MLKLKKMEYRPESEDHVSPYEKNLSVWDDYTEAGRKRANERFFIIIGLIALNALTIIGMVFFALQSKNVIPYIVEVSSESGIVVKTTKLMRNDYKPGEATIKNKLSEFVENLHTISTDQVVLQKNLLKNYDMVTKKGYGILTKYIKKTYPFDKAGKVAVTIDRPNITITKITDGSYQVEWIQEEYNLESSKQLPSVHYTATFTIKVIPPTKEEDIIKNPLGIYVDEFHITRKF